MNRIPEPFRMIIGFTLIELSIVLAVIGLLAGAIVAGKELMAQYELRRQISDVEKYVLATRLFEMKFKALPADFNRAFQFWGQACAVTANACNGDNDGVVFESYAYDYQPFWIYLSLSGLIGDVNYGPEATGYDIPGVRLPKSYINGEAWGGYSDVDWWGTYFVGTGFWPITSPSTYGKVRANTLWLTGVRYVNPTNIAFDGAVVSPAQAYYIDTKMDDGKADAGKVIGVNGRAMPSGNQTNCVTPNGWANAISSADYNLVTNPNRKACALAFDMLD